MSTFVLAGTRKGLFLLKVGEGRRRDGSVEGPLLKGFAVYHAIQDPRDGALYAATNFFDGATVHKSTDGGKTWERNEGIGLPEDSELKLNALWHIRPGPESEPSTLWLGGDPGVLFRTDDGGATWEPNRGLLEHPTRERWQPGAGGMCTHSIQLDPSDTKRMYVGISAAGAFRSDDGGETWTPKNKDVAADFMPDDPYPEVGQCVHKLLVHPARPDRLWQQNHCGVYRSDDRGDNWERLDGNGLPSDFGFGLALDPSDPDVAYVTPEEGADNRVTCDGRLGVYRTGDGGASWELASDGLPEQAWVAVLREAMTWDEDGGVYLGTQSGSLFVSAKDGEGWVEAARYLPPVLSVETAETR